ncbi:Chromatin modification-related protein eaf3 [Neolecta irregularis DAH-3]|uniref:Chromatin modification-related protein EAF3 n=1 Tax=Neolecta irregularis (strain DAH-3) TaxID=1198029 RepID=A0A1U7LMP0_NEOID|nr:Chromatin modification-related protein eaf3 [Neolecta irregularis DAH-3]|eukprot:OLL23936.1 Chromatin modification-related protein eaf3 [Neolecta irregularis DAH-3]
MQTDPATYKPNERVLCFHGPMLYEAKIVKTPDEYTEEEKSNVDDDRTSNEAQDTVSLSEPPYFVHYKGWKQTWDEWVPVGRILKWTEENLKTQKELKNAVLASSKKPPKHSDKKLGNIKHEGRETTPTSAARGQKRAREVELDKAAEEYARRPLVKINIPDSLKAQLVDDWENITKNQQLVTLPRDPDIQTLLSQYCASTNPKKSGTAEADIFEEVIVGIKTYFERSLGNILLYRFERQQYVDIRRSHENKPLIEIYGAEHLLRLFVSLPELIAQTNMDIQSVQVLREHIEDLLKYFIPTSFLIYRFMAKNQKQFFLREYCNASPSYQSMVKNN